MNLVNHLITVFLVVTGLILYDVMRHPGDTEAGSSLSGQGDAEPDAGHVRLAEPHHREAEPPRDARPAELKVRVPDLGWFKEELANLDRRLSALEARVSNLAASRAASALAPPSRQEGWQAAAGVPSIEQFEALLAQARRRARQRQVVSDVRRRLQVLSPALAESLREELVAGTLASHTRALQIRSEARDRSPQADLESLAREFALQVGALTGGHRETEVLRAIGSLAVPGLGGDAGTGE